MNKLRYKGFTQDHLQSKNYYKLRSFCTKPLMSKIHRYYTILIQVQKQCFTQTIYCAKHNSYYKNYKLRSFCTKTPMSKIYCLGEGRGGGYIYIKFMHNFNTSSEKVFCTNHFSCKIQELSQELSQKLRYNAYVMIRNNLR